MLRVSGNGKFDIDKVVSMTRQKPYAVWHRGDPRSRAKPNGPKCINSGANFNVSGGSWRNLSGQVTAATRFLKKRYGMGVRLKACAFPKD